MPDEALEAPAALSGAKRWAAKGIQWGGGLVLAASFAFIGDRLVRLDWSTLQPHASWGLAGALAGSATLFAAADHALERAWSIFADPEGTLPQRETGRIYGRGVLMKYLPGSVFQYASRQLGGAGAGLAHSRLARSSVTEVALHLVASMTVASGCLMIERSPVLLACGAVPLIGFCLLGRRPLLKALGLQLLAFSSFALAAALVGAAVLPAGTSLSHFAAVFLLAWLAGFVVPVAPGGLGVREAALLALAGGGVPAAAALAATLALRAASIAGDVVYGVSVLWRGCRAQNMR